MCLSLMKAIGDRRHGKRNGGRGGYGVDMLVWGGESVSERLLGAVDSLEGLAACRASREVGRCGGSEAQPTAWATNVGHDRPFL
jgi:hypothetical protein